LTETGSQPLGWEIPKMEICPKGGIGFGVKDGIPADELRGRKFCGYDDERYLEEDECELLIYDMEYQMTPVYKPSDSCNFNCDLEESAAICEEELNDSNNNNNTDPCQNGTTSGKSKLITFDCNIFLGFFIFIIFFLF